MTHPTLKVFGEKRFVRWLDRVLSWLEGAINRLSTSQFNPLYHLSTLAIFLLIVLGVTGIYLTVFYRPGTETAYLSVERMGANWFGLMMRSIHRYASDAFMLVVLLHALKSLASGRYWGSRWLAWVSGWVMVFLTWLTGVLGFWLVWDERAQWLTEELLALVNGSMAVTFLSGELASSTFSAFVMALFLHIFFPLSFAVLIFLHVLRLARTRLVTPRWIMVVSTASLVLVALALPVRSAAPADLQQVIASVTLDPWYLGFLAAIEQMGRLPFWLLAAAVFALLILLPWLARGRHFGPAVVTDPKCTGCSMCSVECPYKAIEMVSRPEDDSSGYKLLAQVNPDLCTGCGICVGTCATLGIELQNLPTAQVFREGLLARVKNRAAAGEAPTVVFTCQRQAAASTLSPHQNGVLACTLPCTGMVDPRWTRELFAAGVKDIAFISCPSDDCANREGPHWLSARLQRRKALVVPGLHWLETAPGDRRGAAGLLRQLAQDSRSEHPPVLPDSKKRRLAWPSLPIAALALALLAVLALPYDLTASRQAAGRGEVRVVIEHHGVVKTSQAQSGMVLPDHASVDNAQIMGGERFPVQVQVWVDGALALEESHTPPGLRKEGRVSRLTNLRLPAGEHLLVVRLKDDGDSWREVFRRALVVQPEIYLTLVYDQNQDAFFVR